MGLPEYGLILDSLISALRADKASIEVSGKPEDIVARFIGKAGESYQVRMLLSSFQVVLEFKEGEAALTDRVIATLEYELEQRFSRNIRVDASGKEGHHQLTLRL